MGEYLFYPLLLLTFFYGVRSIAKWEWSFYKVTCPRCKTANKFEPGNCGNCGSKETGITKSGGDLVIDCRRCKNCYHFFPECSSCKTDLTGMVWAKIPNKMKL